LVFYSLTITTMHGYNKRQINKWFTCLHPPLHTNTHTHTQFKQYCNYRQ